MLKQSCNLGKHLAMSSCIIISHTVVFDFRIFCWGCQCLYSQEILDSSQKMSLWAGLWIILFSLKELKIVISSSIFSRNLWKTAISSDIGYSKSICIKLFFVGQLISSFNFINLLRISISSYINFGDFCIFRKQKVCGERKKEAAMPSCPKDRLDRHNCNPHPFP